MNIPDNYSEQTSASFRPKYPMLWFPLHGDDLGTDEATAMVDRANQWDNMQTAAAIATGKVTLTGTTANIWSAVDGVFSSPVGDVYGIDNSESLRSFMDLSTLTHGMVILFQMKIAAKPTDSEFIIDMSSGHGANGGWQIVLNATDGYVYFKVKPPGDGLVSVTRTTGQPTNDQLYSYAFYIDVTNNTSILYRDLVQQTTVIPLPVLPDGNATQGCSFFARASDGGKKVNAAGSGAEISNIQIYRTTEDIGAYMYTIVSQYMSDPKAIPSTVRTVV